MIELKNASKTYENGTKALKDVTLNIEQGEFVFVVGASGAGKSTFLKLILREEVPTSGGIVVNGYDLVSIPKKDIPYFRRTMGVVFQDFRLIQTMTVFDNVAFAMRVIGANEREIRKRVPYVLSLVGLASKARNLPAELSGGEQQRVALARALVNNADMIIADEPTGNVDPEMSYEIVELLNHINASGTTVVMVTHEHDLVRRFNHRTVVIENGSIIYDGAGGDNFDFSSESAQHLHEMNMEVEERLRHGGMTGYYDISEVDETSRFISSYLSEKGHDSRENPDEQVPHQEEDTSSESHSEKKNENKFSWNKLAVKVGKGKKEEVDLPVSQKNEDKADGGEATEASSDTAKVSDAEKGDAVTEEKDRPKQDNGAGKNDSGSERADSGSSAPEQASAEEEKVPDTDACETVRDSEVKQENIDNAPHGQHVQSSEKSDVEEKSETDEKSRKRSEAVRDALGKSIKESLLEGYSFYLNGSEEKEDNGGDSDAK